MSHALAYALIAAAYAAGFGASVVNSVRILSGNWQPSSTGGWWRVVSITVEDVGVVALMSAFTLLVVKFAGRRSEVSDLRWQGLRNEFAAGSVGLTP